MAISGKDTVLQKVQEIANRVGASEGIEIVEVELAGGGGSRLLRIFIDKPGGVTHGDCETISHQVGTILDVEDVIPGGRYHLEVSSPGVERKLKKIGDFERFQGQKVRVTLKMPLENQKNWEGTLAEVAGTLITLEVKPEQRIQFPFEQVQQARLKFEW